jgi:hypothetical protein
MSMAVLLLFLLTGEAHAWWGGGHEILTRAAVRAVPPDMPAFFRAGEDLIAHEVYQPDLFKNSALPQLMGGERPEHYMDLELLQGRPVPETRYAFYDTCVALGMRPFRAGLVPYAVAEWTQRLVLGFAEWRLQPDDRLIEEECLVYAGMLAHYAQDLCQPLHLTVDYDGRPRSDGSLEARGIHARVDGLIERLALRPDDLAAGQQVREFADLMGAIRAEIGSSRSQVDHVYALAGELRSGSGEAVARFGRERGRAAVNFTASLYWTAWRASAHVDLPSWYRP